MRCQSPWSRHNRSILLSDILKAMPITLRDYQPQDREQLTELFDEFLRYLVVLDPLSRMRHTPGYESGVLDKDLQEVREHRGKFAVAVDGTTILGFVIGIIQERKNQPDVIDFTAGRITELYVDEAVRGQHIGTMLMEHIEAYFASQGCDTAKVEVFAPNAPARRLYEKFGYEWRDIDTIKKL